MQKYIIVLLYSATFMSSAMFAMEADQEKAKCTVEFGYCHTGEWEADVEDCWVVDKKGCHHRGFNRKNLKGFLLQIKDSFTFDQETSDKIEKDCTCIADVEGYQQYFFMRGTFKLHLTGMLQENMFVAESGTASGRCIRTSLESNEVTLSIDDLKRLVIKKKKSFG